MSKAGILRATPGPKGGYQLGRPATDITLLDVVEAIEGSARPFICQEIRQQGTGALPSESCDRQCLINVAMNKADNAWRTSLRATTIADIAADLPDEIVERNRKLLAP
jgi:Rrf2 family protein